MTMIHFVLSGMEPQAERPAPPVPLLAWLGWLVPAGRASVAELEDTGVRREPGRVRWSDGIETRLPGDSSIGQRRR